MEVTKKAPSLRFPGFEGEWEEKKLGEVGSKFDYGMNSAATDFDGENKYIRITDIDEISHLYLGDNPVSPLDELEECYLVKEGDILFARTGASVGKSYLYNKADEKLYFAGFLIRVSIQENYSPKFIFSQTLTDKYSRWVSVISTRSGQPGINAKEYAQLSFYCPSLPEQQKIADCLTAMDDTIEAQQQKVEQLKAYKKGLLQQLFSQTLRFPGFEGAWEEKKLGALIQILSNKNKESSVSLVLSVSNSKGFILQSEQFEDRNVASSDISGYKIVKKGEFAFNPARINVGSIAKLNNFNEGVVSPMYICFKTKPDKLNPEFLDSFIKTYKFNLEVKGKLEGSVRQTLSADGLNLVKLHLPTLPEQQKIADCLSTLDEVIELEQQKLEKLQVYKKGLLQQLFV